MTLPFTDGATNLPLPRSNGPYEMELQTFGVSLRMADAALRQQIIARKWRYRIFWHGLSAAERLIVYNVYVLRLSSPSIWTLVDGRTVYALATVASWAEGMFFQPHSQLFYYDVNFQIEEI